MDFAPRLVAFLILVGAVATAGCGDTAMTPEDESLGLADSAPRAGDDLALVGDLRDRLREHEGLDQIAVDLEGDTIVLRGWAPSEAHLARAEELVREHAPDHQVENLAIERGTPTGRPAS